MHSNLLGSWQLLSCERVRPGGDIERPYGSEPIGRLSYFPGGRMQVFLMQRERESFSSVDWASVTPAEMARAFQEFDAYGGSFSVQEEAQIVVHRVEYARIPAIIGTDQIRYFSLENDLLVLRTDPYLYGGEMCRGSATWKKISPD